MFQRNFYLFFVIIILFVTSCSEANQSYAGESENWKVNYGRNETMVIVYSGEKPPPEEKVNISIEQRTSLLTTNIYLTDGGINKQNVSFNYSPNVADVKIRIKWDGKSENVILKELNP
ncbi:hypothetical protein SAMN05216389_11835 [Oceanobacillus limi]|uniref:Uncharacterized protein n=1 Tax=Oceanobacillus limi TaxID=930131 RepID=A0A1I0G0H3_9BACI|nr:hypothetical protein [Oceanobacillus limi]SET64161.1 hypothetical protein SAMN05216389_11835 [Oceanobacillus limi]